MLSGACLCDGLITRPEESYRLRFVYVSVIVKPDKAGHNPESGRSSIEGGAYKISQNSVVRWASWNVQTKGQTSSSYVSHFASLQTHLKWVKFLSRLVIHFAMKFEWRCSRILTENLYKMEVNGCPRVSATFPTPLRIGIDS